MHLLIQGTVTVSVEGVEACVMDEPGDMLGEFGAVTGKLRSASVTARDAVNCIAVRDQIGPGNGAGESPLFNGLLQQAIIKPLLARPRKSNEELLEVRKARR